MGRDSYPRFHGSGPRPLVAIPVKHLDDTYCYRVSQLCMVQGLAPGDQGAESGSSA